jgi:putative membrane protein insertion efficiency factor
MTEAPNTQASTFGRSGARAAIRAYQLTLSALVGSQCRHLPTCSAYMDEAIGRHGVWAGGFMGLARLCRCHPLGTAGFDPVPNALPAGANWLRPWRYGRWRGPLPDIDVAAPAAPDVPGAGAKPADVVNRAVNADGPPAAASPG